MRLATLVAIACGCGRVAFDELGDGTGDGGPVACAPSGHDEDGDSVDDTCDVCPHLSDPMQADSDGDRVGDACDPEPALPRQRIALFDPFVTLAPGWSELRLATVIDDELLLGAAGTSAWLYRAYLPGDDSFVTSAITGPAPVPATQHLFALDVVEAATDASYYCELVDNGTRTFLQFTHGDGSGGFATPGTLMMTARVGDGAGIMTYSVAASGAQCSTEWSGETARVSGPLPAMTSADRSGLYANDIDVRFAYYLHIRSE